MKIIFNAPFSVRSVYNICLFNLGAHCIAYSIKTSLPTLRLDVNPSIGILEPLEKKVVTLALNPFHYRQARTYTDYILFCWVNAVAGTCNPVCRERLHGHMRRKRLPIEYNPL